MKNIVENYTMHKTDFTSYMLLNPRKKFFSTLQNIYVIMGIESFVYASACQAQFRTANYVENFNNKISQ